MHYSMLVYSKNLSEVHSCNLLKKFLDFAGSPATSSFDLSLKSLDLILPALIHAVTLYHLH